MKSIICVVALIIGANAFEDVSEAKVLLVGPGGMAKFLQANPNVTVTELEMSRNPRYNQIWYTLGSRQSGDGLVGINNGWAQYPSKQNLELTITYPINGSGAIVTYLQVLISQDNGTTGRGYVVYGGIGYRYIKLVVEAWSTSYLRYDYAIYGR
jgi:Transcription activator MBF2